MGRLPRLERTTWPTGAPSLAASLAVAPSPAAAPALRAAPAALQALPAAAVPALSHLERSAAMTRDEARGSLSAGSRQFDGAAASYRYPTYAEQRKIDESLRRGSQLSPVARDLINEFRNQGGQFAIDPDIQAAYHGRAFRDRSD